MINQYMVYNHIHISLYILEVFIVCSAYAIYKSRLSVARLHLLLSRGLSGFLQGVKGGRGEGGGWGERHIFGCLWA